VRAWRRRLFAVLVVSLVGPMACSGGGVGPNARQGWTTHTDARGFSIQLPKEWSVRTQEGSGRVEVAGPNGAEVVVWPFFLNGMLDDASAGSLLGQLAVKVLPRIQWQSPSAAGQGAVRMEGDSGTKHAVSILGWVTGAGWTAGDLYFTTAERAAYSQLEPTLADILGSFRITGAPVKGQSASQQFVQWRDPAEGAFTVEIPKGWSARGGAERPSSVLVQSKVELSSPEGLVYVYLGDDYPVFVEPNPTLQFVGIGEGDVYTAPDGYRSPVQYYAPGNQFLLQYVLPRLAQGFQVVSQADRQDVAGRIPTTGINSYDAGELEFSFDMNGQPYRGGAFIVTERISSAGLTDWQVWRLVLFMGPQDRYFDGSSAAARLVESFRVDPQWAQRQAQTTAEQSRIIAQAEQDISTTISQEYWGRQAAYDAISERRSQATLDVQDVVDPSTGQEYRVESGSSYYWVDNQGYVVGTTTDTRPSLDFRQLLQLGG
jgi:hypothetical protein